LPGIVKPKPKEPSQKVAQPTAPLKGDLKTLKEGQKIKYPGGSSRIYEVSKSKESSLNEKASQALKKTKPTSRQKHPRGSPSDAFNDDQEEDLRRAIEESTRGYGNPSAYQFGQSGSMSNQSYLNDEDQELQKALLASLNSS
jgi:hypothetical protein